ncbi:MULTISPECIES: BREX-2 system adenine-specific DNA-methyltransferase PglX [unclassified Streptomyces]|uniref:BREX-2 system adenine-specific DNA-methyltransferase PglX n=1 Tax=unclassified Streptomyces TaxID=2593676 RepID=UPI002E27EFE7|nr:BREX-2 system adenine-specific DNA-methyltransferase PglX [Streptomyces sp. NBC_00223]
MPPTGGADTGTSSLDRAALVTGVRKQVRALEADLRERSDDVDRYRDRLRATYEHARASRRTAATYGAWRDERITQAAVAWVLGTVFVRFCEDNGLIDRPFIAGPGLRLTEAEELQAAHRAEDSGTNDQDWLAEAFTHLARSHVAMARIFDRARNSLWELWPSPQAAAELIAFWRRRGEDGSLRIDFTDSELDTDFLGDLYQDISETSRRSYALIRTPDFIVEFLLDLTVDPAVAEFGPRGFRGIDPACGSGAFPLGLFARLLDAWRAAEPGTPDDELIRRTLHSVHGCDVNPFAVSITRFRLLMAVARASGRRRLSDLPEHVINVAAGDALLDGRGAPGGSSSGLFAEEDDGTAGTIGDVDGFAEECDLLGRNSYHAVISEPPFTVERDKAKSAVYRQAYDVASGMFPLSVLFTERMFQLAVRKSGGTPGGYIGQYTSSSFTRREFGEKLIGEFFPRVTLTHVIDTSGVYAPGHGTPTLILVGRNDPAVRDTRVRSVFGGRGEPTRPTHPAQGIVWKSILDQIDRPGSISEWVSVQDEPWQRFFRFPWTLTGGGDADLMDLLSRAPRRLADVLAGRVGLAPEPGQRDVFALGRPWFLRHPDSAQLARGMVTGETVSDWRAGVSTDVLAPYGEDDTPLPLDLGSSWGRHLWTMRQVLRAAPGARESSRIGAGPWWAWRRWPRGAHKGPAITFASVATHNRFALERGGRLLSRTAPVLRLSPGVDEDEYIALLGVLNSSTVGFWLKQSGSAIGAVGPGVSPPGEDWARVYRFTPASLSRLPLPTGGPLVRARELHALARQLDAHEPGTVCPVEYAPVRSALDAARATHEETRSRMIALQEELDWEVYGTYGLLSDGEKARLTTPHDVPPPALRLGERAFEIVLARRIAAGEASDSWFVRHGATPITDIPQHWPAAYSEVVQARIDAIESHRAIAIVERPEYKRRWVSEPWERREKQALRTWLLDHCEDERLWFEHRKGARHPRPRTIDQLARDLGVDAAVRSAAVLYASRHLGRRDATLRDVLAAILAEEHVPYVGALRYKESGLRKRAQWEQVWQLQRSEDRTGEAMGIPVPPRFSAADFRHASYWSLRGSLDIPRERFVSYPGAVAEGDSPLIGWSGWSDTDRVLVLLDLVGVLRQQPQPRADRIAPLLAGIQELIPWVRQWEAPTGPGPNFGHAETFQREFDDLRTDFGLSTHDLTSWRPRKATSKGN